MVARPAASRLVGVGGGSRRDDPIEPNRHPASRLGQNRCSLTAVSTCILMLAAGVLGFSQPVEIVNLHGNVSVEIEAENRLRVWWSGTEPPTSEGIVVSRSPVRLLVDVHPPASQVSDIQVRLPLGLGFSVKTDKGDITVSGMVRRASLQSVQGSLSVTVPLDVTSVNVESTQRPGLVDTPPTRRMPLRTQQIGPRMQVWKLVNMVASRDLAYGRITAQLHDPGTLRIRDWPIPQAWPLKPHLGSVRIADAMLARGSGGRRSRALAPALPQITGPHPESMPPSNEGTAIFRSEVRMVSLTVAVSDSVGRPMIGLGREDFLVTEDGQPQDIEVLAPELSPFNLGVLLDLSGSTSVDLNHMRNAALRLVEMASPNDRIALYAMAGSMFHRLSELTSDREFLVRRLRNLPHPIGGSPLWDVVLIAYGDQLAGRAGERNGLVVITDGIDNRISGQSAPSRLTAAKLVRVAAEMDARIYPIFLLSGERFGRNWSAVARKRLEALARETGGRLFTARSVADVEPVLPELARELRSVYEIAYYPADQNFDGNWRRVKVKASGRGSQVRARPGYFAD